MDTSAKAKLIKYVTSPGGNVLVPIILGGLSIGAAQLAGFIPETREYLTEANLTAAAGFAAAIIIAVLNAWTNGKLRDGVKIVQQNVNKALPINQWIEEDGVAGPQTQTAVAEK